MHNKEKALEEILSYIKRESPVKVERVTRRFAGAPYWWPTITNHNYVKELESRGYIKILKGGVIEAL